MNFRTYLLKGGLNLVKWSVAEQQSLAGKGGTALEKEYTQKQGKVIKIDDKQIGMRWLDGQRLAFCRSVSWSFALFYAIVAECFLPFGLKTNGFNCAAC